MKRLIRESAYFGYFNKNGFTYSIYKNPTSNEVKDIKSEGSDLRGVIHPNGTVFAWPGEIYHLIFLNDEVTVRNLDGKVIKDAIVDDSSFTITYDPTYIDGVLIAGAHGDIAKPSEIVDRITKSKSVLNNISKNIFVDNPEFGHMKYETALKHIDVIDNFTISDDDFQSIKFIDDSNFDSLYKKNNVDVANYESNIRKLIKNSEFYEGLQFNKYYEIYKNPTSKDISNLIKANEDSFNYIRGILSDDGNMYVWLGNLLHDKVINKLGISDGIHFDIEKDYSLEIRIPNMFLDQFIDKMYPFKTYFNNLGLTDSSKIYIYCSEYVTSLNENFNKIKTMSDIWNNKVG